MELHQCRPLRDAWSHASLNFPCTPTPSHVVSFLSPTPITPHPPSGNCQEDHQPGWSFAR
eukprot:698617-Hanusia_phi.AAC.4